MKLPSRKRAATAQTPVHKGVGHYGRPITLDQAKKAMAAAEAKAKQNNLNVVISIVDSGGHAVMLQRLDGTQLASIRIAEGKARTAVEFRRPTKELEDVVAGGGAGLRYFTVPEINLMEGRSPHRDGRQDRRRHRCVGRGFKGRRSDRAGRCRRR